MCDTCVKVNEENRFLKERIKELEKENRLLKERIGIIEQTIKSRFYKPNKQAEPGRIGPPRGHKANHRPKPAHVDETINLALDKCPECSHGLSKVVEVRERFIEDIKPAKPYVKKYLVSRYYCRHCRRIVYAKPAEIPKCRFGLNLLILITFLRYAMHLPLNKIAKQLDICYGLAVSEGSVVNELTRFADYLGPEFQRIKSEVRELAALNIDETGWRINGKIKWLWDFIGKKHSLLAIRDTRGKAVLNEVLGKHYGGIVTTDCLHTYDKLNYGQQKCWAHLLRETKKIGGEGKLLHNELKHLLSLAKSGEFTKDDILHMLDATINKGFTDYWCINIVDRLKRFRHEWFTFMEHPDVSDTNNAAERGLRPSVVMRKITGGSRSDKGARNHEVIMSVMQTWDKQGIDFMDESMRFIRGQLTKPRAAPVLGPFMPIINQILFDDQSQPVKQRHKAAKIYRRLRDEYGYKGGYDQVRRYVKKHRKRGRETFIPLSHEPGERLEADFGHIYVDFPEGRKQVPVLVTTWSHSSFRFAIAFPTERLECVLTGLVCAFEFYGCVARQVWCDNSKTVVKHLFKGRSRQMHPRYRSTRPVGVEPYVERTGRAVFGHL